MKTLLLICCTSALLLSTYSHADQVVLKNGDRLTGQIQKLDGDKLDIKTEFADVVHLQWSAVSSLSSDMPLYLKPANQEAIQATRIEREGDGFSVSTASNSRTTISKLEGLRSSSEQTAYEKSLTPGLFEFWSGGFNFGFGLARGNSKTTNLSTGTDLSRKSKNDKLSLYETSIYSTDKLLNATTANAIRGGLRYDRDIAKRIFGFGSGDFEHDELQGLDLRSIAGGGLGFHAVATPKTSLDLLGGMAWTHESYSTGLSNNFLSAQVGEELSHQLWEGTSLKQRGFIYPNLTGPGGYRAALDIGLSSKIYKRITWQNTLSDRYVSTPIVGKVGNDLLLTTGVGISLGTSAH